MNRPLLPHTNIPPEGCLCASFWTVRGTHKKDCPLYSPQTNGFPCPHKNQPLPECSGCSDPNSEGTHQGCTKQHGHVGCDLASPQDQKKPKKTSTLLTMKPVLIAPYEAEMLENSVIGLKGERVQVEIHQIRPTVVKLNSAIMKGDAFEELIKQNKIRLYERK